MKLTPEIQIEICKYISDGLSYVDAAELSGITERTFYNWKKRGQEEEDGIYFQFFQALKKADIEFKQANIKNISTAASNKQWQASAWLLERKFKEFSKEQSQSIDKPALFLESLQFIAEILHEVDPQGLKVISKNFQVLTSRFKIAVKGENEKSS